MSRNFSSCSVLNDYIVVIIEIAIYLTFNLIPENVAFYQSRSHPSDIFMRGSITRNGVAVIPS